MSAASPASSPAAPASSHAALASPQPTIAASQPATDLAAQLALLRTRVDEIQVDAFEKKKPWYRDVPVLISFVAVLISVLVPWVESKRAVAEEHDKKLATLQQLTMDLVDVRKSILDASDQLKDPSRLSDLASVLNTKRVILIQKLESLADELGADTPPEIYVTLANEEQADGHFSRAEKFYRNAIDGRSDPRMNAIFHRTLAGFYLLPNTPVFRPEEATAEYKRALESLGKYRDEAAVYQRGYTEALWGYSEMYGANNFKEGDQHFHNAEETFKTLSLSNPVRTTSLQALHTWRASAVRMTSIGQQAARTFCGTWEIDSTTERGMLVITEDSDSGILQTYLQRIPSVNPNAAIVATGIVQPSDSHTAIFNWNIDTSSSGAKVGMSGAMNLRLLQHGGGMEAVIPFPGGAQHLLLHRVRQAVGAQMPAAAQSGK